MPAEYHGDFVRGYFDGDGNVWYGFIHKNDRKNPLPTLLTRFTSGSKGLLQDIASVLHTSCGTGSRESIYRERAFRMQYSAHDSSKIYRFMYNRKMDLYLERKRVIFEKYLGT